jgi:hypothetical protein
MNRKYKSIPYHHRDIIYGVQARLIYPSERKRWDALIRQHHYLGLKAMVGKTLRYFMRNVCYAGILQTV